MDISRNFEPILTILPDFEVCEKVSNNFNTTYKSLKIGTYFNKCNMWGNGL